MEASPNTVMMLNRPPEGHEGDGACFVINFTKTRHFWGKDAEPKLVKLATNSGESIWHAEPLPKHEDARNGEILRLINEEGKSQTEVAQILGVNKSTVSRVYKKNS